MASESPLWIMSITFLPVYPEVPASGDFKGQRVTPGTSRQQ